VVEREAEPVRLRPVDEEAYAAYRALALRQHSAEIARGGRFTSDEARALVGSGLAEGLADFLAQDRTWLFRVVAGDSPAGWLWLGPAPREPSCVMVYDVRIDENRRGSGLGRAAMEAAEGVVADAGYDRIALQVLGWNTRAESLYRSLGYRVDSTQMSKQVGGAD